jgi:peptidoglycan-N-acetylmuramic acid deacetylase
VPAAFFLVGDYLERNANLVRRMAREGHIVGNHTMNHPDMTALDEAAFAAELQEMETLYQEGTGQTLPKFYRPPQGVYSQKNLEQAKALGYKTVFWSLAYADWDNNHQPDPDAAVEKLNRRIHDGAVILLHSTSATNAQILEELIGGWQEMGYRFAPLTELFSDG